jgi:hypothetical protein
MKISLKELRRPLLVFLNAGTLVLTKTRWRESAKSHASKSQSYRYRRTKETAEIRTVCGGQEELVDCPILAYYETRFQRGSNINAWLVQTE